MGVCIREPLAADRTYYVRTDGSDSNNGLTNDAAGAFLTIQKAVDTVADQVDIRGFDVTIQVADGAYNAPVNLLPYVGRTANARGVLLRGNPSTPSSVTIDLSAGACIGIFAAQPWLVDGFSLSTTGSGTYCVTANTAHVSLQTMEFRAASLAHVRAVSKGSISLLSSYSVSGGAQSHLFSGQVSTVFVAAGITVTLSGTPSFSTAFAEATSAANINTGGALTFSGSCTGKRYSSSLNAVIGTNGGGPNVFPGTVAGTTATGGQYA